MVEIDDACQQRLRKHWPGVPIIGDIRDVTKETLANATGNRSKTGISRQNSREEGETNFTEHRGQDRGSQPPITLITGGFPCQPVSVAGKRRGKEDDRWLWPEMLRVIREVRSAWVVAENVAGLIRMGLDDCLSDLEGEGFEAQPFLIPACAVNAPHRRDRIFIVAHSRCRDAWECSNTNEVSYGGDGSTRPTGKISRPSQDVADAPEHPPGYVHNGGITPVRAATAEGQDVANAASRGKQPGGAQCDVRGLQDKGGEGGRRTGIWAVEPDVGRVAHGIPSRVDRLRALGNAVVPQQIYPILKAIADIESSAQGGR